MILSEKVQKFLFRFAPPERTARFTVKYGIVALFGLMGAFVGYIVGQFIKGDIVCLGIFMECHSGWMGGALLGLSIGRIAVSQVSLRKE